MSGALDVPDGYAVLDAAVGDPLEVSPPGEPMPNARHFLGSQFGHSDHVLLMHQGGNFFAGMARAGRPSKIRS